MDGHDTEGAGRRDTGRQDAGRQDTGRAGEDAAAAHLTERGCEVLARNWRCRDGEIDLIVRDGPAVVFCEVKCRTGRGYGSPLEAITRTKLARLRGLAAAWLRAHPERAAGATIRLDAIGILMRHGSAVRIDHVRGIG